MEALINATSDSTKTDLMIHQWKVFGWLMDLDETRGLMGETIGSWQSAAGISQHRKWVRFPLSRDIVVTPMDESSEGDPPVAFEAAMKDISPDGLSFLCSEALPYRRVTVEIPGSGLPLLLVELSWSRFTRDHTHQCGGRFVGVVD